MSVARTYLDYNATSPLRPEARAAVVAALDSVGNASSTHAEGRAARALIEGARADVAKLVAARASAVVFTSGATEAANWVLRAAWRRLIVSAVEHPCILEPARASGAQVDIVPVGRDGLIDMGQLEHLLADETIAPAETLLAVQHANNETGVVQDVAAVAGLARGRGVRLLVDAVQSAGRLAIDFERLGADYLMLSSHKFGGPKGVGALVMRGDVRLPALLVGGGQERGHRAGTENVEAIAGFGAAARAALGELSRVHEIAALRDALEDELVRMTPQAEVIGRDAPRLANTSLVALRGRTAETLIIALDLNGVAASAGAACSSGKAKRSEVLDAMGLDADLAKGAVRFSFGWASRAEDVAATSGAWQRVMKMGERARAAA